MSRLRQLYRVEVLVEGQDGVSRWQPVTGPLAHCEALSVGNAHERAGRRARLEDHMPGKEATGSTCAPTTAQLDLTR